MYPSRHTLEYMNEMDKLFSRNHEFDLHSPMLSSSSHSFHSIIPSSSSTETSPESYPDITTVRQIQRQDDLFDHRQDARPGSDFFDRSGSDTFERRSDLFDLRSDTFERRSELFDPRSDTFEPRLDVFERRPEYQRRPSFARSDTSFERPDVFERQFNKFKKSPDTFDRSNELKRQDTPFKRSDMTFERSDIPFERSNTPFERRLNEREAFETPFIIRRQRPIIGRKIMATNELPKIQESNVIWQPIELPLSQTPPKSNVYELFPMENRGFEIRTPMKSSYSSPLTLSPIQVSPNLQLQSSPKPITPQMMRTPPRQIIQRPFSPYENSQNFPGTSQNYQQKICTFCKKNGETPLVYMAHSVKEKVGNQNIVTCPILRRHVCSTCGASGDNAHTITYCPILRSSNNGQPLRSTTITLKNTRIKSNGRRRY